MQSIADELRDALEARGEYVVRANADSGWFAIFPDTWRERTAQAQREGREGPNLIVYRTKTTNIRDHYVIPNSCLHDLLVDSTLTHSDVNGISRWNLTLRNGKLHVTHSDSSFDVAQFHGGRLIVEETDFDSRELVLANEVLEGSTYREGSVQKILVNRYERDPRARSACVEHYGTKCHLCGIDFESVYGPEMAGFIHVHHLMPLAAIGMEYEFDPITDLCPVCPNCHAVLHRRDPPYSLDEVRAMIEQASETCRTKR